MRTLFYECSAFFLMYASDNHAELEDMFDWDKAEREGQALLKEEALKRKAKAKGKGKGKASAKELDDSDGCYFVEDLPLEEEEKKKEHKGRSGRNGQGEQSGVQGEGSGVHNVERSGERSDNGMRRGKGESSAGIKVPQDRDAFVAQDAT